MTVSKIRINSFIAALVAMAISAKSPDSHYIYPFTLGVLLPFVSTFIWGSRHGEWIVLFSVEIVFLLISAVFASPGVAQQILFLILGTFAATGLLYVYWRLQGDN